MRESPIPQAQLPKHVAIIMDGNGRWAAQQGLERSAGHEAGAKTVQTIVQRCAELGIEFLTLYSFSTENWSRPPSEIDALMELLMLQLSNEVPDLIKNGIKLKHYGLRTRLSQDVLRALDTACKATADGTRLTVGLAIDYSGRSELMHVMKRMVSEGITADEIDEAAVESRLFTAGTPDPDLLIRTAGEYRVSNFLLWQIAYSEIHVSEKCWPAFDIDDFDGAMTDYASRTRKFGTVK